MDRVGALAERFLRAFLRPPAGVVYAGVFLTPMAQKKLLKAFPPEHAQVWAHHMTVWHYADGEALPELPWGKQVQLKVVRHVSSGAVQAVAVSPPTRLRPYGGRVPHITISTAQGTAPAASKGLFQGEWEPVAGLPAIKGRVGWVDEKGAVQLSQPRAE